MSQREKPKKQRLDVLLTERGLAGSRQKAQALILAGKVSVDGKRTEKAGSSFSTATSISVESGHRYVSRAGEKLAGALADFGIDCTKRICLDVGSSTGGFTDCLLQHGARRVFAVDVTISQLDWKLRSDPRVVTIEANGRYLEPSALSTALARLSSGIAATLGCAGSPDVETSPRDPAEIIPNVVCHSEPACAGRRSEESLNGLSPPLQPNLITMDLSFISVTKVLPKIVALAGPGADFLILVKPQFELERADIGRGGIVRDQALHQRAIEKVSDAARALGLQVLDVKPSRLAGAEGNQEFFVWAKM